MTTTVIFGVTVRSITVKRLCHRWNFHCTTFTKLLGNQLNCLQQCNRSLYHLPIRFIWNICDEEKTFIAKFSTISINYTFQPTPNLFQLCLAEYQWQIIMSRLILTYHQTGKHKKRWFCTVSEYVRYNCISNNYCQSLSQTSSSGAISNQLRTLTLISRNERRVGLITCYRLIINNNSWRDWIASTDLTTLMLFLKSRSQHAQKRAMSITILSHCSVSRRNRPTIFKWCAVRDKVSREKS